MIDELSLKSHTRVTGPFWDKASELDEFAAFSRLFFLNLAPHAVHAFRLRSLGLRVSFVLEDSIEGRP
jgi:hypothetical protein